MRRTNETRPRTALAALLLAFALGACGEARSVPDPRVDCSPWAPGATQLAAGAAGVVAGPVRSASVGRDGAHLVYRSLDGRLMARRTASGEERQILLADDASVFPGAVDAGRFVAFTHRARDNYEEYFLVDVEACRSRELHVEVSTSNPIIGYSRMATMSLAGQRLFYAISRGTVRDGEQYLVELEPLASRRVEVDTHAVYGSSVEGDRVVWLQRGADGSYAIGRWTAADGALRTYTVPEAASPSQLSASRTRAAWTDHRDLASGHKEHVYVLDLTTGAETRVTTDGGRQMEPSVLGRHVAWADDRTGRLQIHVADLEAGTEWTTPASSQPERWPTLTDVGLFWIGTGPTGSSVHLDPSIRP